MAPLLVGTPNGVVLFLGALRPGMGGVSLFQGPRETIVPHLSKPQLTEGVSPRRERTPRVAASVLEGG
eukprot:2598910-Alexandrium_andersonii.AAC.1